MQALSPIGVLDSGVGGFTVIKQLQDLLPGENIIYFGDGGNQPYGNRDRDDILFLTRQMLDFLQSKQVKTAALACNTISNLIDLYQDEYPFRIFSIVEAGCTDALRLDLSEVAIYSTVFTAQVGMYAELIHRAKPSMKIYPQGSPWLARIVEDGEFTGKRVEKELEDTLGQLVKEHPDTDTLILGCTDFPFVTDYIRRLYPQFTRIIDPSKTQISSLKRYLEKEGALNPSARGTLTVYTTSYPEVYRNMARAAGCREPDAIEVVPPLKSLC